MTQKNGNVKRALRSRKRQIITLAFLAFIVYVLLLSGIFSYFHSEDLVTNKYKAQNTAVRLLEPEWDLVGINKAKASEPGMIIPKNPYAKNEGQNSLYIRLKMTVSLGRFDSSGRYPEYAADFNNDKRRLNSILNALEIKNENTTSKLFVWDNKNDVIENWTLRECYNKDYYMEDQGFRTLNDGTTEQVFYFYYVNGTDNGENSEMRVVESQNTTTELFNQLQLPILKKDYLGVFDQNYNIAIEAQAVTLNPSESPAVSVQKAKFN